MIVCGIPWWERIQTSDGKMYTYEHKNAIEQISTNESILFKMHKLNFHLVQQTRTYDSPLLQAYVEQIVHFNGLRDLTMSTRFLSKKFAGPSSNRYSLSTWLDSLLALEHGEILMCTTTQYPCCQCPYSCNIHFACSCVNSLYKDNALHVFNLSAHLSVHVPMLSVPWDRSGYSPPAHFLDRLQGVTHTL